jgi:hypothetical protein
MFLNTALDGLPLSRPLPACGFGFAEFHCVKLTLGCAFFVRKNIAPKPAEFRFFHRFCGFF